jgi:outer membrane receptor protein involved in Fe transport
LVPLSGALAASDDEAHFRVQNRAFVKHYLYRLAIEETLAGALQRDRQRDIDSFGAGDGVRVRLAPWAFLKLSYEYALRMPNAFELFGDGARVRPNLELEPEISHNVNLSPTFEWQRTAIGALHAELTGFVREVEDQIVLMSSDRVFKSENVASTRSFGADASASWTSPGRYLNVEGAVSVLELRNRSAGGAFAAQRGDRLPNKPWLSGDWAARLHFELGGGHQIEPFYWGRFVAAFFRGWESAGRRESKQTIPSQLAHSLGITYAFESDSIDYSATFELQNVTDALLYDYFGSQRPGRSYAFKLVGSLH